MKKLKTTLALAVITISLAFATATPASAKGNEYDKIVRHLKSKYRAKKVGIPFMWLARVAVKVVRPAGVKSFNVTFFENLQFTDNGEVDREMQSVMREAFGEKWSPIFRIRSRSGEQVYMYARESGDSSLKIALVTIQKNEAAVIRATVDADKLLEFMDNPKILGVSIGDDDAKRQSRQSESKPGTPDAATTEKKNR